MHSQFNKYEGMGANANALISLNNRGMLQTQYAACDFSFNVYSSDDYLNTGVLYQLKV
jgi:hypothetical protein